MKKSRLFIIAFVVFTGISLASHANKNFGIKEKPGSTIAFDIEVKIQDSSGIRLKELINKPTLISFVDYRCKSYCPRLLDGISELIVTNSLILNIDYNILTFQLNTEENRESRRNRESITRNLKNFKGWHFCIADSTDLSKLTESIGYSFIDSSGVFIHPVVTVLITPQGKLNQYYYGYYFNAMQFDMDVKNAKEERFSASRIRTLKYCNEKAPKKNPMVKKIIFSWGIIIVSIALGLFVFLALRKNSR